MSLNFVYIFVRDEIKWIKTDYNFVFVLAFSVIASILFTVINNSRLTYLYKKALESNQIETLVKDIQKDTTL